MNKLLNVYGCYCIIETVVKLFLSVIMGDEKPNIMVGMEIVEKYRNYDSLYVN